ncbi:MAG TPA: radical SAM protein [Allosphingosinicella sp.]|jgi:hypothetical protein|nr:radical SAM protein [Allosphingosinicella sp.]
MPSIYIVNPAADEPSYYSYEVLDGPDGGWVQVADLTIATLAGFVPEGWSIRLAEEAVHPVDLDADVDFVAITGKVTQRGRMIALAAEFRRRGRTVLIGGPFATLSPADMRPHADILVTGELEELAPRLFADLAAGRWQESYDGGRADIRKAPMPRWDLYPVERAQLGALQTTRGCPFSCEFCDVIQYQGRKQRHKDVAQVLRELDALYAAGFRNVFLVDDNFTVHRARAREVLDAIASWNAQRNDPVAFLTQASLDIARDDDMLERCRAAGLTTLFMGVETINEDSLREAGKRQNLLMPTLEAVDRIVGHGIGVHAGIIVGFDHDGPATFGALRDFFAASPLPELGIGVLTAPEATDLYRRLARDGRLSGPIWETAAQGPFATNVVPLRMSREALIDGTLALARWAFSPEAYEGRMMNFIERFGGESRRAARAAGPARPRNRTFLRLMGHVSSLGEAEARMVKSVLRAAAAKPATLPSVLYFLGHYAQARFYLDGGVARREAIARACG